MKKIALTFLGFAVVLFAFAQEFAIHSKTANGFPSDGAAFSWIAKSFDFGKIQVGIPVTQEFKFTNTGASPLVITSVQASCGCTVTSYSTEVIQPGKQGFVKATYNAAKVGQFNKTVSVMANTDESVVQLTISGEVVE